MAVDWFRLLWDLRQRDVSFAAVARHVGLQPQTIQSYLHGGQPAHWRGEVMIDLWCDVCQESRDNLPMCEVVIMPRVSASVRPGQESAMDELERAWR